MLSKFPWLRPYQQQMQQATDQNRLAHAILLAGPAGIGKTSLSNWLAAVLLCRGSAEQRPCGQCKGCLLRHAGNHPDLLLLDGTERSIGVEEIRQINEFVFASAQQQGVRLVLIKDADNMTLAASNALLKTLEEPPAERYMLLQTTRMTLLPATIISRCQQWLLPGVFDDQTQQWLKQQSNRNVADFILDYAGGGPLQALRLIESGMADQIADLWHQLDAFFAQGADVSALVRQMEKLPDLTAVLGFYLRTRYVPQLILQQNPRHQQIIARYNHWCRDDKTILGQNKVLALTALLLELKQLAG